MESLLIPGCTEKKVEPFLPTGQLQSCLHETAEGTGEHHAPHAAPLPTPWKNYTAQPLERLNPPAVAKLKNINSEL
jgi:hypothetical protein